MSRVLSSAMASALVLMAVPASAVAASTDEATSDPKVRDALSRVESGAWTEGDLKVLRSRPELAAQIVDPSDPGIATVKSFEDASQSARKPVASPTLTTSVLAASRCKTVIKSYRKKTLLGRTAYVWNHEFRFCYNGSRVTSVPSSFDYVTSADGFNYVREVTASSKTTSQVYRQRKIENCVVKYGCIKSTYPSNRTKIYGSGSYSSSGTAG